MKLSASNIPTPNDTTDYSEPTTVLLLPAFTLIRNVQPSNVPQFITEIVSNAPTNTSPLAPFSLPTSVPSSTAGVPGLTTESCPHRVVVLLCSQKTRDARCGQSAPLIRKELERHLRPLGLARDLHDERPGGVGIYFIDHVGGHKYSANVMIYRRPNAFGHDDPVAVTNGEEAAAAAVKGTAATTTTTTTTTNGNGSAHHALPPSQNDLGAGQCIWLARVRPEDCENLVRYTILKGKVVKPERQLRGGFDRGRGLMSW